MPLFPTDPLSLGNAQRLIQARTVLTQNVSLLNQWLSWIYNNPNKNSDGTAVTPQQVCDNLGASAGALFASAQALASVIGAATGITPAVPPTGWSATVNADGTITLTQVTS